MDLLLIRRHIQEMQFTVTVRHDEKEGIWFVQSSDIPGLNAEAASFDALMVVIADVAPDLIVTNVPDANIADAATIPLCVQFLVTARRAHAA